jgi:tRNA G18 (ribose-2'-O)-methylase SpoU
VLDNVRSAWNVGALFRTADGLGISRIWLGGITPPPTHPKARKTALGAERTILWETNQDTATILASLRNTGWSIWALEQASPAAPLEATQPPDGPLALVVGNEISGVGTDLFAYCDQLVYIPMQGVKRSLNVEVAAAIALWYLLHA